MDKRRTVTLYPNPDYTDPQIAEYALAVGQFTLAWNGLHDRMGHLFLGLLSTGEMHTAPLAVWHAIASDRSQRAALKAGMEDFATSLGGKYLLLVDPINWLTGQAEALETKRNNVIHAPIFLQEEEEGILTVVPSFWGNRNAKALHKYKDDVIDEIRYCRDEAMGLGEYCWQLRESIGAARAGRDVTLPDKPKPPRRGQKNKTTPPPQSSS